MNRYLYFQVALGIILALVVMVVALFFFLSPRASSPQPPPLEKAQEKANKSQLSEEKQTIREHLIATLNGGSGMIEQGSTYDIFYLADEKVFQIRIKTIDIDKAEADGMAWFEQKGLSQKDICSLPVLYYLPPRGLQILEQQGKTFNSTPQGC